MSDKLKVEAKPMKFRQTNQIRLKDKIGKDFVAIDLKQVFRFHPQTIIIKKVPKQHDRFIILAPLPEDEQKGGEE